MIQRSFTVSCVLHPHHAAFRHIARLRQTLAVIKHTKAKLSTIRVRAHVRARVRACACGRVGLRVCGRVFALACTRACVCASVRARELLCLRECVRMCVRACVCAYMGLLPYSLNPQGVVRHKGGG